MKKEKLLEKYIWKIGLENGAIVKADIEKQKLDCLNCNGYNLECRVYKYYQNLEKFTLPYFPNQLASQAQPK